MSDLFNFYHSSAEFSPDRLHRYRLWRIWDQTKPCLQWIGLNPSTAAENENDATIRRVITFTRMFGYGGLCMTNLFTLVSTKPDALLKETVLDLEVADNCLLVTRQKCADVVFCWGNFKIAQSRTLRMMEIFPDAYCLGKNSNGSPKHPCRLKSDLSLIKFIE